MVQVINDKNIEYDETLLLYLTSGEGVHLTPFARAEVVIANDDGKQSIVMHSNDAVLAPLFLIHRTNHTQTTIWQ